MSTDAEIVAELRELTRRMSPSAIPDLRGRARQERAVAPARYSKPYPVYGLDSLCDYLEAVFAVLGVGGCGNGDAFDWSIYDERRSPEFAQHCVVEDCMLSPEYPRMDGTPSPCIRHRGLVIQS